MSIFTDQFITLVIQKRASGSQERLWGNTYKIQLGEPIASPSAWETLVTGLAQAEAGIHTNVVEYVKARVSTYVPDSQPYDPNAFITFDIDNIVGARVPGTEVLPRQVVLQVRRQASAGRQGKLSFRGALTEGDLAGSNTLFAGLTASALATFTGLVNAMYSDMSEELDQAAGGSAFIMSPPEVPGGIARYVTGFQVRGVGFLQYDHRWFNRQPA